MQVVGRGVGKLGKLVGWEEAVVGGVELRYQARKKVYERTLAAAAAVVVEVGGIQGEGIKKYVGGASGYLRPERFYNALGLAVLYADCFLPFLFDTSVRTNLDNAS